MVSWVNNIHQGDCLKLLRKMPDEFVDCIVTSPPYYGLRDYGVRGQVGLEDKLDEYLEKMLSVTAELKRVLKETGTMFWNHGDSYGGSGKGNGDVNPDPKYTAEARSRKLPKAGGLGKCLMLQNFRLAQRMIDEQRWILRNVIIWHKPNALPSSVKDRFTVDFEPVFFFTKSKKYWFEPQPEPSGRDKRMAVIRRARELGYKGKGSYQDWAKKQNAQDNFEGGNGFGFGSIPRSDNPHTRNHRNKRSVWRISTKPFAGAHFAVFPPELIETPIKVGCPEFICKKCGKPREKILERGNLVPDAPFYKPRGNDRPDKFVCRIKARGQDKPTPNHHYEYKFLGYSDCGCKTGFEAGVVLDPFMGAGTTALVARNLGRNYIGLELNGAYIKIAERRLFQNLWKPEIRKMRN